MLRFSGTGRLSLAAATLVGVNLAHYKLDRHAFQRTVVVDRAELFDVAPERDGSVPGIPGFSYRLLHPLSSAGYQRYFGGVPRTGDALQDAVAVARRVRELYVHGQAGEIYPWLPDLSIPEATRRPVVCGSYARTQVSALDHMGHVARVVHLQGHIAPEVYDFERRGWLYVDPNGGVYLSAPEGPILSIAQIVERLRLGQPFRVHRIDASTDDPLFSFEGLRPPSPWLNGYQAYQDGPGLQYRRKTLFYVGRLATLVVFRQPHAPRVFDGLRSVLVVNLLAAIVLAVLFLPAWSLWHTRRAAGSRRA